MSCADLHQHPGYSLQWIPDVLRAAGLTVIEESAWKTRGHGDVGKIMGVLCHHTASAPPGNAPDRQTVIYGRPDLAGPLAQLLLCRDATYRMIAAGKCWHAGPGHWPGIPDGNGDLIAIEAENNGVGEPWSNAMLVAYAKGCAALLAHIGQNETHCLGHKEWAPDRKSDPDFDMIAFRARVATYLEGIPKPAAAPIEASPLPAHVDAPKPGTAPQAPPIASAPLSMASPSSIAIRPIVVPKAPFSFWRWLTSFAHPAPGGPRLSLTGNANMLSGSKTYMGVTAILAWVANMVINGQLPIMPAIGSALAALTLAFLRHGISTSVASVIEAMASGFEGNSNVIVALVAKTVDQSVQKALADFAAAQNTPAQTPPTATSSH